MSKLSVIPKTITRDFDTKVLLKIEDSVYDGIYLQLIQDIQNFTISDVINNVWRKN